MNKLYTLNSSDYLLDSKTGEQLIITPDAVQVTSGIDTKELPEAQWDADFFNVLTAAQGQTYLSADGIELLKAMAMEKIEAGE